MCVCAYIQINFGFPYFECYHFPKKKKKTFKNIYLFLIETLKGLFCFKKKKLKLIIECGGSNFCMSLVLISNSKMYLIPSDS